MTYALTPGERARQDQGYMAAKADLDRLVNAIRTELPSRDFGDVQIDLVAHIHDLHPSARGGLLMVAVMELAKKESS